MPMLADHNSCTGCTACAGICPAGCIEMHPDENGFFFPLVADAALCISCGLCEQVCPVINLEALSSDSQPDAFAAYSDNETLRMDSSSGGIFSELALEILRDNGEVCGASYDDSFTVCHDWIRSREDLHRLRGAKYAESNLGNAFFLVRKKLEYGQPVLFSGTPCQVAGLRSLIGKEDPNLLCVDFVCHSIPSPAVWKAFVEYRAGRDAGGTYPEEINLRSKTTGWSHYRYSNLFRYSNGITYQAESAESLYMKLFVSSRISRSCCGNCRFKGYSRPSDITLGDFWGIWEIAPEMDDNKGTSVVLIHSEKGRDYWKRIQNRIKIKPVTLEQASRHNPSMLVPAPLHKDRAEVLAGIREDSFERWADRCLSDTPSVKKKIKKFFEGFTR